jgi:DNA repair protein RecO (recombination protein O)
MTRIENTPAFLIHRRMYQGNSLLLDFFTEHYGKIRLIARGARSKKTSLQMFQCLKISYTGKGDLKNLTQWESNDDPRRLMGDDLIIAIYANELLSRLLPQDDEYKALFDSYWSYIKQINKQSGPEKEYSLRLFENQLLQELGYGLDFSEDYEGNPINPSINYEFHEHQGFFANADGKILGDILLNIANANKNCPSTDQLSILKILNRKRLKLLLGEKPLKSRELFFVN